VTLAQYDSYTETCGWIWFLMVPYVNCWHEMNGQWQLQY